MYKRWEAQKDRFTARRVLRWLKKAKTWQLILILLLCGFIAATFLRLNNIGMIERRDAVLQADKKLDTQKAKQELVALQHYVSSHMNSDLGKGIFLENIYNRDYAAAIAAAAESHNSNSDIYQKAAIDCRAKFQGSADSFRNDYVTCVANAVAELPENQQTASTPHIENYHYNFASPLISFDIAGIAVVIMIGITVIILLRLALLYTLKAVVRHQTKIV